MSEAPARLRGSGSRPWAHADRAPLLSPPSPCPPPARADSKGRTVDFKNTLIILTSNVGSSVIEKGGGGIGFQLDANEEDSSYNRIKSLVNEELKQYFRCAGGGGRGARARAMGGAKTGGPRGWPPPSPPAPRVPSSLLLLRLVVTDRHFSSFCPPSNPTPPHARRPEFLNRLDEIIVFRQLTKGEVKQIADIMLRQVFARAEEKGIKIDVTGARAAVFVCVCGRRASGHALSCPTRTHTPLVLAPSAPPHLHSPPPPPPPTHLAERFKDRLVDEGYNPAYGARPLRRAIMRLLEDSMAERMLAGDVKEGDSVILDVDADGGVSVLNGDKKMTTQVDSTPAGIS